MIFPVGWRRTSMVEWYVDAVKDFVPIKQRKLPRWATNISQKV